MSMDKGMKYSEIDKSTHRLKSDESIEMKSENKLYNNKMDINEIGNKPTELSLQGNIHLVSSTTSSLADTPGDSGVQCLDSEASEVTSQALMSHSLVGAEELTCDSTYDAHPSNSQDMIKSTSSSLMTRSDIDNSNISQAEDVVPELLVETNIKPLPCENLPDVVLKALESEKSSNENSPKACPKKSLSEDIVFRRRCRKKSQSGPSSQKKRVSFHEDILNKTKTDNIHIERGFVSQGPETSHCERFRQKNNGMPDRFSWCASGDRTPQHAADVAQQTMSDILTYNSKNDKSGIFEYCDDYEEYNLDDTKDKDNNNDSKTNHKLYGCESNSSDSNFSCDSESSSDSNSSNDNKTETSPVHRKCDKAQKSYSCDAFESNVHAAFMRKTYFSEADIDHSINCSKKPFEISQSPNTVKSVLKKNRYITTNIVAENKQKKRIPKLLQANNIIDSLKTFYKNFNFNFTPEKGVPEICVDINNVVEALPCDQNKNISKSLDSGFQIDDEDGFVEINLNGQPKEPETQTDVSSKIISDAVSTPKEGSPRHKLTLNMKPNDKRSVKTDLPPLGKSVVNCESTVYEHKGVSYNYVHDTFQTAFDAPKEAFVPIPDSTPIKDVMTKSTTENLFEIESSNQTSTPKKQFSKIIQDENDKKNNLSKHLASPKKTINRYGRKPSIFVQKPTDENSAANSSDNCSNTDNSTLKDVDYNDDFYDNSSSSKLYLNRSVLLNRYLKNVCQKKDFENKIKTNKFFRNKILQEKPFPSIVYPLKEISNTIYASAEKMSRLIDKEVIENKRLSIRLLTADEPSYFDSFEDNVAIECNEKLKLKIFSYPNETLNRMMKVQSPYNMEDGSWTPLLVFITDYALYVASVPHGGTEYDITCRLPHDQLDAIAIGPEGQYIQIVDLSGNVACSLICGDSSLGARLASSLEWSARTSPLKISRPPSILSLSSRNVSVAIMKLRKENKVPDVLFYGDVCSGDAGDRLLDSPGAFAPPLEGYLMCKANKAKRFEPCYFLLRAGVLHWGPSPDGTTPLPNSISLSSALGVRRNTDESLRPHCFEIALKSNRLLLAAPDDPTASSWLQSLLLHAAQAMEEKSGIKKPVRTGGIPTSCSVLATPHEVISLRHTFPQTYTGNKEDTKLDVEILACGSIKNLTSFKIPDTDENWCCLEWSVCEARERGAGLALVFCSSNELERFIAAVELAFTSQSNDPFPLSVIEASKSACSTAHSKFLSAWVNMLPGH